MIYSIRNRPTDSPTNVRIVFIDNDSFDIKEAYKKFKHWMVQRKVYTNDAKEAFVEYLADYYGGEFMHVERHVDIELEELEKELLSEKDERAI